jgi:phytoene dehydrogenase-like protein
MVPFFWPPIYTVAYLFVLVLFVEAFQAPATVTRLSLAYNANLDTSEVEPEVEEVDVAIVGAGIGGLCAGAILNTLYNKKVGIYESHYLPGGCAHAFERSVIVGNDDKPTTFTFDSGPTIVLGCSKEPYNPLQQVLRAVGVDNEVEWLPYDGWGMIEHPKHPTKEKRWKLQVGPNYFEAGPLKQFASNPTALDEFNKLREITQPLVTGAATIPALAMRPGQTSVFPLLRYLPSLLKIISNGVEASTGPFAPYINGPIFTVTDPWLRNWLDALAFSLSGLPAERTSAGAMAYVLFDMHRQNAALDYPRGGLGKVVDALVNGVEQKSKTGKNNGSKVHLRHHVESIDTNDNGDKVVGLTVRRSGGAQLIVKAKDGVICNAPMWSLRKLIKNNNALGILGGGIVPSESTPQQSWVVLHDTDAQVGRGSTLRPRPASNDSDSEKSLLEKCDQAELTGSFLHLHVALDKTGLDMSALEPHYTVMDRGLEGGQGDGPCGELNMIAVSNPCVLDESLTPDGYIIVHAYGAGNEPFDIWKQEGTAKRYQSATYEALKEHRAKPLWRAIESIIPNARERTVLAMLGSPLTHQRFLRRPFGSYGAAFEDCLKDGSTPITNLILTGDGVFPGIGIPAVALNGASAANGCVGLLEQWLCMDELKSKDLI